MPDIARLINFKAVNHVIYTGKSGSSQKDSLSLYWWVLYQKREDRGKIYNLHKPFAKYIARRTVHKPYEFGNKVGLIVNTKKGHKIIVVVKGFIDNLYDDHTVEPLLDQRKED